MKPLGVKSYGSIPHLRPSKIGEHDKFISNGQQRILTKQARDKHDVIIVTEKYDGSNVGICRVNGEIIPITRSGYKATESKFKHHVDFANWVFNNQSVFYDIIPEGWRLCGEWLGAPHSIIYEYEQPIVFFDLITDKNKRQTIEWSKPLVEKFGLQFSRILHIGEPIIINDLVPELNKKDHRFRGNELPEGMVYRCERKGVFDFIAKWVRSDFEPGKLLK